MSAYAEVRDDFYDEDENKVYIDAWFTDDANEDGIVIAKVNTKSKEVEYLEDEAKTDSYAQEVINGVLKAIDNGEYEEIAS